MKKKTKIISIALVALLVLLVLAANIWRRQSLVRGVKVDIDYLGGDTLVTDQQVEGQIRAAMPHLTTTMLRDVDLKAVEQAAAASPWNRTAGASPASPAWTGRTSTAMRSISTRP